FTRGQRFFVRGKLPGVRTVTLLFNGVTNIGSDGADDGGTYLVTGTIPASAKLGANTVVARGLAGSTVVSATCGVNVLSSAATSSGTATLPRTGVPTSVLIAVGVTMVELGAALLVYTDRRRAQPVIGPWLQRAIHRLER